MVRVDSALRRCYLHRIKLDGDVPIEATPSGPMYHIKEKNRHETDILPIVPYTQRRNVPKPRPRSNKRISWSAGDEVRRRSPSPSPEREPVRRRSRTPQSQQQTRRHSPPRPVKTPRHQTPNVDIWIPPERNSWDEGEKRRLELEEEERKHRRREDEERRRQIDRERRIRDEERSRQRRVEPVKRPPRPKSIPPRKQEKIMKQRDDRWKREKQSRKKPAPPMRRAISENELRPRKSEPSMMKHKSGKSKKPKQKPQRWNPVGDVNRKKFVIKDLDRPYVSDFHF
ncbi:hypothetical protein WR25_23241 [Diploscapter pachys]|uniref:Uncharacterized protein n=1 Tax=Diploscapter pachys TaxID=2018661 RepID=A0A2A2JHT9_9BILA|nr:hypothetical protein WR25_23241 [Diploscapter pachys]